MTKTVSGDEAHAEAMAEYQRQREEGTLKATCSECMWFAGLGAEGDCRRNAPVVVSEDMMGDFPSVRSGWWCGQFELRERSGKIVPTVGDMAARGRRTVT